MYWCTCTNINYIVMASNKVSEKVITLQNFKCDTVFILSFVNMHTCMISGMTQEHQQYYNTNAKGFLWHTGVSSCLWCSRSHVQFPAGLLCREFENIGQLSFQFKWLLSINYISGFTLPPTQGWLVNAWTLAFHKCSLPVIACEFDLLISNPPW